MDPSTAPGKRGELIGYFEKFLVITPGEQRALSLSLSDPHPPVLGHPLLPGNCAGLGYLGPGQTTGSKGVSFPRKQNPGHGPLFGLDEDTLGLFPGGQVETGH